MEENITIVKSLIEDLEREEKLIGYNAEIEIQALIDFIKEYKDSEDILKNITKENLEYKQYIRELEREKEMHKNNSNKLYKDYNKLTDEFDLLNKENNRNKETIKRYRKYLNKKDKRFKEALENEYQERETDYIPKSKIKEIVDECIPKGKNIITGKEEYQPNTNANSFLTQRILELMEDK